MQDARVDKKYGNADDVADSRLHRNKYRKKTDTNVACGRDRCMVNRRLPYVTSNKADQDGCEYKAEESIAIKSIAFEGRGGTCYFQNGTGTFGRTL